MIHLDTHVVAWLWAGESKRLRPVARVLEREDLVISPMVVLELQYLHEIGRLADPASDVVTDLVARIGLRTSDAPPACGDSQSAGARSCGPRGARAHAGLS